MENKKLIFSIVKFLKSEQSALSQDKQESLSVAIESLEDVFEVDDSQKAALDVDTGLADIFNKHSLATPSETPATPAEASPEDVEKADALKAQGNAQMSSQKYQDAIDSYTQAISLHPTNKILYSSVPSRMFRFY